MADNEDKNETIPTESDSAAASQPDAEPEEQKIACDVKITDNGPWKKKVVVTIPREEIDKELNEQYRGLIKTADVPGFRKGRAPRRLVEKRFGENVADQTKLKLVAMALQQIEKEHHFDVLTEPEFDVDAIKLPETGDLAFDYEIEIKPEFETPEIEGVRVEKQIVEITPERVDAGIEQLRQRLGHIHHITEGVTQADDLVVADVAMKVEGMDEPEKAEGVPVRVGAAVLMGARVEGLAKALDGIEIGQTVTCSGQLSDGHPKEEYRGKKADFTLNVRGIDRLIPLELNEQFFSSLGVSDAAGLRKIIEENLENQAERESRDLMKQQVYNYLSEKVNFDLPVGVASRHAARLLSRRYYELMQRGVPQQQIVENLEQLKTATSEQSARQLKQSFIMDRVADKLEIEVTEGEVNAWIAKIAAQYRRRPERVREEMHREGMLDSLRDQIRHEKAVEKILEMADVVDAPIAEAAPKEEEKKEEKPKAKSQKPKEEKPKADKKEAEGDDEEKPVKKATPRKEVKRKPPKAEE